MVLLGLHRAYFSSFKDQICCQYFKIKSFHIVVGVCLCTPLGPGFLAGTHLLELSSGCSLSQAPRPQYAPGPALGTTSPWGERGAVMEAGALKTELSP